MKGKKWGVWAVFFLLLGVLLIARGGEKAEKLGKPLPFESLENRSYMEVEKKGELNVNENVNEDLDSQEAASGCGKVLAEIMPKYEKKGYEVYVGLYDFKTGTYCGYKDEKPFYPASLTKALYLGALLKKAEEGKINLEEEYILREEDKYVKKGTLVKGTGILQGAPAGKAYSYRQLAYLMIAKSDNVAANIILRQVGIKEVNRYIKEIGLENTSIYRLYYEIYADRPSNRSTARDLTWFLVKMGKEAEKGDKKACEVINIMQANPDKRIGKYLGPGFKAASKTGTVTGMVGDMALIYTTAGEKVLALTVIVKADGQKAVNVVQGEKIIGEIAREILVK